MKLCFCTVAVDNDPDPGGQQTCTTWCAHTTQATLSHLVQLMLAVIILARRSAKAATSWRTYKRRRVFGGNSYLTSHLRIVWPCNGPRCTARRQALVGSQPKTSPSRHRCNLGLDRNWWRSHPCNLGLQWWCVARAAQITLSKWDLGDVPLRSSEVAA